MHVSRLYFEEINVVSCTERQSSYGSNDHLVLQQAHEKIQPNKMNYSADYKMYIDSRYMYIACRDVFAEFILLILHLGKASEKRFPEWDIK